MNKKEFLKKFQDILQTDVELSPDTCLLDLEEWDSLATISTIAFLDSNFGLKISVEEVQDFNTITDITNKIGL